MLWPVTTIAESRTFWQRSCDEKGRIRTTTRTPDDAIAGVESPLPSPETAVLTSALVGIEKEVVAAAGLGAMPSDGRTRLARGDPPELLPKSMDMDSASAVGAEFEDLRDKS